MEYRKFDNTYFIRIQRGEEILETLAALCEVEHITLGTITGIGAVGDVTLGAFDRQQFAYQSQTYTGDFEIASCSTRSRISSGVYPSCSIPSKKVWI